MNNIVRVVNIPLYPSKVLVAKARRGVPYVSEDSKVRGKVNIPPSFLNNPKYIFNEKGILIVVETGESKLANPKVVGQPRYWVVNFQDIWNQNITKQARAMRVDKLKAILRPYIVGIRPIKVFPLEININLYDTSMNVDISNKGVVYIKVIEDLLVGEGVIPDDTVEYINCSGRVKYIQVEKESERRLELVILKSNK